MMTAGARGPRPRAPDGNSLPGAISLTSAGLSLKTSGRVVVPNPLRDPCSGSRRTDCQSVLQPRNYTKAENPLARRGAISCCAKKRADDLAQHAPDRSGTRFWEKKRRRHSQLGKIVPLRRSIEQRGASRLCPARTTSLDPISFQLRDWGAPPLVSAVSAYCRHRTNSHMVRQTETDFPGSPPCRRAIIGVTNRGVTHGTLRPDVVPPIYAR
jgi:hypothetical protein